jgi:hypothetical protein
MAFVAGIAGSGPALTERVLEGIRQAPGSRAAIFSGKNA